MNLDEMIDWANEPCSEPGCSRHADVLHNCRDDFGVYCREHFELAVERSRPIMPALEEWRARASAGRRVAGSIGGWMCRACQEEAEKSDRQYEAMLESTRDLLRAVGMHDGARPESPAAVHTMAVRRVREIVAALAASEAREAALREALEAITKLSHADIDLVFMKAGYALAEHDARGGGGSEA